MNKEKEKFLWNCTLFRNELADLQREISRKDKLLDAYLDSLLTKEEYQRKAQALDEHILELKREVEANKANLADLAEIQRVRENIDAEVAQYLDENEQLKVEFVLEHLSQVIIYPDKVLVIFDVFGEGVMVEKSQYVSRQKWLKIQTENIYYLTSYEYGDNYTWRTMDLYVQLVA